MLEDTSFRNAGLPILLSDSNSSSNLSHIYSIEIIWSLSAWIHSILSNNNGIIFLLVVRPICVLLPPILHPTEHRPSIQKKKRIHVPDMFLFTLLLSRFGGMYSVNSPKSTFKYKHNLHKNFKSHRVCLFWQYLLKFVCGMSSSLQTFVLLIPRSCKISSMRKWRWSKSVTYSFVLYMWNISYKSILL